jgi:DNA-binding transcriptional regulator YiaG
MPFFYRLKAAREAAKLSQAALGALTGYCVRTIRNWESGKREPHALVQAALFEIINRQTKWN